MRLLLKMSLIIVLFFSSCKKDEIKLKNIKQTDVNGNIIYDGAPQDWLASSDTSILVNNFGEAGYVDYIYEVNRPIMLCDNSDNSISDILVYPNPTKENKFITFEFTTQKDIRKVYMSSFGGQMAVPFVITGNNAYKASINVFDLANKSGKISYIIITNDSCMYTGYGTVIVE